MTAGSLPTRLLTIAGSDSGGGAGIQADLKTFAAHGAYGMSAITAVTAQNTVKVSRVLVLEPELVAAQIDAVVEDLGVDAVKIGMLGTAAVVRVVAEALRRHEITRVVLDPVMIAKTGDSLLGEEAVEALRDELIPLATLVTPNLPEAARLVGRDTALETEDERREVAREIGAAGVGVLVKGGHGTGETVVDLLWDGDRIHRYEGPRLDSKSTHGTGCTLSSAIAARTGRGEDLPTAVSGAVRWVRGAIRNAPPLGEGHGPLDHLWKLFGNAR